MLLSTFGGPECRLGGLAGEPGKESRFLVDPLSGVPLFSIRNGLCKRALALADRVGVM